MEVKSCNPKMHYEYCQESAEFLKTQTKFRPTLGVICGTGLSFMGELLEPGFDCIPYNEIPHFVTTSVPSHKANMLFGKLRGVEVMVMQGRFHHYEGHAIDQISMPVRVMHLFGIEKLIVSNAAGGINPKFRPGDIMLLNDHVNLMGLIGTSALRGEEDTRFGPRFFALNGCYKASYRQKCMAIAQELGYGKRFHEGVYIMVGGPNFETPAELRMLQAMGVDAVGMSTVHEATTARQCNMEVFAFSLITNVCVMQLESTEKPTVEEIFSTAVDANQVVRDVIQRLVPAIAQDEEDKANGEKKCNGSSSSKEQVQAV